MSVENVMADDLHETLHAYLMSKQDFHFRGNRDPAGGPLKGTEGINSDKSL